MKKQPHRCPVCEGKGLVPPGFYQVLDVTNIVIEVGECRSCKGTGIVWEPKEKTGLRSVHDPG